MLKPIPNHKTLSEWFDDLDLKEKLNIYLIQKTNIDLNKLEENFNDIFDDSQVGGVDDIKGEV